MDSTVKSLVITGTAAEDATRSRQKKVSTRKQRQIIKEEDDELVEQAKQFVQQKQPTPVINLESKIPQVVPPIVNQHIKSIPKPTESKVILNPPKVQRVRLQPKIQHQAQQQISNDLTTTRKARRIHLSSTNLSHRFTRAKRVKEDTEKKPVGSIRDYLVSKGVIQQKSKAPEKMLRSMYSDFMLLKDQAL